jgi:acetyl esterase
MAILRIILSAGANGLGVFPSVAGPMFLAALVGAVLGVAATRRGARRTGKLVVVISVLTAIGAGAVIARHALVASAQGAPVNVISTLVPRLASTGAGPDETHIFTHVDGQELKLDIYKPRSTSSVLAPVAIHIHGGGWRAGGRADQAANLRWLADRGYLGISLDYVLSTPERATWNTAAPQVACGLSWIAAHAAKFGGDPGRLFMFGESAGGALALTTAYASAAGVAVSSCGGSVPAVRAVAAQVPALDPVALHQNADAVAGGRSRHMVNQYLGGTPVDHPDRARAVSSITYITPNAPPTLIFLADDDHLVPIEGALRFIDRATQTGVSMRIVRFPWADHSVGVPYYSVVNQAWLRMMRAHFCRYGGDAGATGCTGPG